MSDLNILEIVQEASTRLGLSAPTSLIGSGDQTTKQMFSLLNESTKGISRAFSWECLQREASLTTVAAQDQGAISTLVPNLKSIINDTIWNRTLKRPVFGPLSPQLQAQNKAFFQSGPWNQFYIREGHLWFYPQPVAGQSVYVQYISKAVGKAYAGTEINKFTLDTDIPFFDEELLILAIKWRFRRAKRFDSTDEKQDYEGCLNDLIARDGSKPVLSMDGTKYDIMPGIFIPAGSWPL